MQNFRSRVLLHGKCDKIAFLTIAFLKSAQNEAEIGPHFQRCDGLNTKNLPIVFCQKFIEIMFIDLFFSKIKVKKDYNDKYRSKKLEHFRICHLLHESN